MGLLRRPVTGVAGGRIRDMSKEYLVCWEETRVLETNVTLDNRELEDLLQEMAEQRTCFLEIEPVAVKVLEVEPYEVEYTKEGDCYGESPVSTTVSIEKDAEDYQQTLSEYQRKG